MIIPMKNMNGAPNPHVYMPVTAGAVKYGEAMVFASGKLAKCGQTEVPEYICMFEGNAVDGEVYPAVAVSHDEIYETTLSVAGSTLKLGDKVTLSTDGLQVTATPTNGVAEIVAMFGNAKDDIVRVKF